MRSRSIQIKACMEHAHFKLRKEYIRAVYCHPAYVISMQSTSCEIARLDEAQSGIKTAERNVNNLRYADDTEMANLSSVLWRQGMESTNR